MGKENGETIGGKVWIWAEGHFGGAVREEAIDSI
jgi:hypothetical protein